MSYGSSKGAEQYQSYVQEKVREVQRVQQSQTADLPREEER